MWVTHISVTHRPCFTVMDKFMIVFYFLRLVIRSLSNDSLWVLVDMLSIHLAGMKTEAAGQNFKLQDWYSCSLNKTVARVFMMRRCRWALLT